MKELRDFAPSDRVRVVPEGNRWFWFVGLHGAGSNCGYAKSQKGAQRKAFNWLRLAQRNLSPERLSCRAQD